MRRASQKSHIKTVLAALIWIGVWQLASMAVGNHLLLASPVDTAVTLASQIVTPVFWTAVLRSFCHIAVGFLIGFALAVVLGFAAYRLPWLRRLLEPAMDALKSIPVVCFIMLLLMWVGPKRVSIITVVILIFPALYFSVLEGLDSQDHEVIDELKVMGVKPHVRFQVDTYQQLLPFLVATCRNMCGMAWKAGVAAEVLASPRGTIGEGVYQARLLLNTANLFSWTITIVLLSWVCERLFLKALTATGPWALKRALRNQNRLRPQTSKVPGTIRFVHTVLGYPATSDHAAPVTVSKELTGELEGGSWILQDASGSGKTTCLMTICGLLRPLQGRIEAPVDIALVCQEPRLVSALTASENVQLTSVLTEQGAKELLCELLSEDVLSRPVSELSGGQKRRVELVRALAHPSALVLLDEPFASLDVQSHYAAAAFIRKHLQGRTLIVSSHVPGDQELLHAQLLNILKH